MSQFKNRPALRNDEKETMIKRYVHSPLTIEHNGTNASIQSNGKVVLSKPVKSEGDMIEFDEIEIPASLIFKLGNLLRATRKIEYVAIGTVRQATVEEDDSHEE